MLGSRSEDLHPFAWAQTTAEITQTGPNPQAVSTHSNWCKKEAWIMWNILLLWAIRGLKCQLGVIFAANDNKQAD